MYNVHIKGYRRKGVKAKKATMDSNWVPGVNHIKRFGRWSFDEFADVYQIQSDFEAKVTEQFDAMIDKASAAK